MRVAKGSVYPLKKVSFLSMFSVEYWCQKIANVRVGEEKDGEVHRSV